LEVTVNKNKLAITLALSLSLMSTACGAILNGGSSTLVAAPGITVDGMETPVPVSKKTSHIVVYPDGHQCVIGSSASAGYIIADIFLTGLIGLVVDAATSDWSTLDNECPGVTAN
jgi:hypothetical protein